MTVEISSVLPRIGFAIVVGFIFFLILRSELSRLQHKPDTEESVANEPNGEINTERYVVSRLKRYVPYDDTNFTDQVPLPENSTHIKVIAYLLSNQDNLTEIRRELEDNRIKTDFLFWVICGIAVIFVTSCFVVAIVLLLQSHVSLQCSSRSRAYRDKWWETKDEDYVNYASFFRQNIKLVEEMDPIDADTRVHDASNAMFKRPSRPLSTIDEGDEFNVNNNRQSLITSEYSVDLTPGVKGTGVISSLYPVNGHKTYKVFKPPLVSMVYNAPDFRKAGMPYVCVPALPLHKD